MRGLWLAPVLAVLAGTGVAEADPPVVSYIFPAGGQRGKTVQVRVGGLFLHDRCSFEMLGPGIQADAQLRKTNTVWFEGPLLPLPESQQAEDYPKDMAGRVRIAADAALGARYGRLWNSQGATPAMKFMVGDLPEIVEQEIEGDPVPVEVKLPVTINGRIFPRENVDIWAFEVRKGQSITCEVCAARLGSPLDSCLEVLDRNGCRIAENDDYFGADSFLRFTALSDGKYQVRIHDVNFRGGQAYVYRLTLTADPYVDRVYPLGGRRGSKVKFELAGQGLPNEPVEIALPATEAREYEHRLSIDGKLTNPFLLDLDDLPEYFEVEPNDDPQRAPLIDMPAIANGRIAGPGDVDCWAFRARKGEVYEMDLRAARLGSPLQAVLTLCDAGGKELGRSESTGANAPDPSLRFTATADGTFHVRVQDRFRSRGGPAFAYRLRMDRPAAPDFRLRLTADAVTVGRGNQAKLKVLAERLGGFAAPIALTVAGLPAGVTATGKTIAGQQTGAEITFKADATAAITASRIMIRGSAKIGEHAVTRTATLAAPRSMPELDSVRLAVALPTPFKVVGQYDMRWAPRGTIYHRRYRIERGGYQGPIEIRLADRQARHLQGVTGPTITVPAGVEEFDYAANLPPWMETGRTSRTCVMAVAVVKDADGSEHTVSFSSTGQSEQMVAVVEPGRLGVEAERASFSVLPGKTLAIPLRVSRGRGLQGPVKLELVVASHLHGISAEPLIVAADQSSACLPIHFATDVRGPFNIPLVLRATVTEKGEPVTAETKVELHPAP